MITTMITMTIEAVAITKIPPPPQKRKGSKSLMSSQIFVFPSTPCRTFKNEALCQFLSKLGH